MSLVVHLFSEKSKVANHPTIELSVPDDYKIIGGGSVLELDQSRDPGNLLTASYPKGLQTWFAAGKDHGAGSPATITAFALALYDPHDEWDVVIKSETSDQVSHPQAVALVPDGYTLTGGGAFVDFRGEGNLLTASYPNSYSSWEARSKDHGKGDPSRITAYAIGLRHRAGTVKLETEIKNLTGPTAAHPEAQVCLDPGWILSGGGAFDDWSRAGNLLTSSYPHDLCWLATGKDHLSSAPASITAYAIGIAIYTELPSKPSKGSSD